MITTLFANSLFIRSVFIANLLYAGHCVRHWVYKMPLGAHIANEIEI